MSKTDRKDSVTIPIAGKVIELGLRGKREPIRLRGSFLASVDF